MSNQVPETEEKRVWGIHTKDDNLFLKENVIALGWQQIGDLSLIVPDRESFKEKYIAAYPDAKKGSIPTGVGMLFRFCHEVQIGDYIIYPSKIDRMINIGEVTGGYKYVPEANEYVQQRSVKWLKHVPRMSFSQGALYEIGSAMSFFMVKNYADEFLAALDKGFAKSISEGEEDDTVGATADDIIESTKDFILKELSRQLKGYDLEQFVADLLQQVKSQDSDIKETTIQSLKGAMREGDYGLFVTLSNYTKKAQKYLENTPIIRGINGTELVDLILKYYDDLSEKYRKMIPLKMVYIPVSKDE